MLEQHRRQKVQVDGRELETGSKFVYLGGTVTQEGGSGEYIKSRLRVPLFFLTTF